VYPIGFSDERRASWGPATVQCAAGLSVPGVLRSGERVCLPRSYVDLGAGLSIPGVTRSGERVCLSQELRGTGDVPLVARALRFDTLSKQVLLSFAAHFLAISFSWG
jgi:hypothetical protein